MRLRPILMATLALIAGMIPVALGWRERLTARFRHRVTTREPAAQASGG